MVDTERIIEMIESEKFIVTNVEIAGAGYFLPEKISKNRELAKRLEVDYEWIYERSGIAERRILENGGKASDMAFHASTMAIKDAQIDITEIDMIVVATFSGDHVFPPLSAKLHQLLKLKKDVQVLDVQVNCAGFATALSIAFQRLNNHEIGQCALVVGCEHLTKYVDPNDLESAMFLGDGAGACILKKTDNNQAGLVAEHYMTDSTNYNSVKFDGLSIFDFDEKGKKFIDMNGIATWKQVITNFPRTLRKALANADMLVSDVDVFVFHQANVRLIEYLVSKMKLGAEKTIINAEHYGNTGSASMAIALAESFQKKLIQKNMSIVVGGVGAGYNFSVIVVRT